MPYLIAAFLGGWLLFNTQATPHRAEGVIRQALQSRFPGATVAVHLEGRRGRNVLRGRFDKVDVGLTHFDASAATGFTLTAVPAARHAGRLGQTSIHLGDCVWNEMRVQAIDLQVNDFVYDWDALKKERKLKVVASGPVQAKITIPVAALQTLVTSHMKDVEDVRLEVAGDRIVMHGRRTVMGVPLAFTLNARLEAHEGNEFWLADPVITLADSNVSIPAGALLQGLNPIYVIDARHQWPYRVDIATIKAHDDVLDLSGVLTFVPAVPASPGPTTVSQPPEPT